MSFSVLRHLQQLALICALFITSIAHGEGQVDLREPLDDRSAKTLSAVVIDNRQIFENPEKPGPRLINFTHWVTRKRVIAREVWLQSGDPITQADLNELERNLRALNLFSEVNVSTRPCGKPKNKAILKKVNQSYKCLARTRV